MGSLTTLAAGTLAAALVLASGAMAFHEDDLPLLGSGGGAGSGWASMRFTTDGGMVAADVMKDGTGAGQAAAALYDEAGSLVFGFTFTAIPGKSGAYVDLHPAEGLDVHHDAFLVGSSGLGAGLTINDPEFTTEPFVGTLQLVVWGAGDGGSWSWALRGEEGVRLDASDGGDHAFLYTSEDFSGVANVQAYASGLGGRVTLATAIGETMSDDFIGAFFNLVTSTDAMTMTSPSGTATCPCFEFGLGEGGLGAGAYSFALSGAGAGVFGLDEIILGGADARLPA